MEWSKKKYNEYYNSCKCAGMEEGVVSCLVIPLESMSFAFVDGGSCADEVVWR